MNFRIKNSQFLDDIQMVEHSVKFSDRKKHLKTVQVRVRFLDASLQSLMFVWISFIQIPLLFQLITNSVIHNPHFNTRALLTILACKVREHLKKVLRKNYKVLKLIALKI